MTYQDRDLETQLPAVFDAMVRRAPDDPGVALVARRRARRHRATRWGVAAGGTVAAASLAVGGVLLPLGSPGSGAGGTVAAGVSATSTAQGGFALVRAPSPSAPALATVDGYEVTVMPKDLEPYEGVRTRTSADPAEKGLEFVNSSQAFRDGKEIGGPGYGARLVDVSVSRATAAVDPTWLRQWWDRGAAEVLETLPADETLELGTIDGQPAFVSVSHGGVDIDILCLLDPRSGVVVQVKTRNLSRAEAEAVVTGLRTRP